MNQNHDTTIEALVKDLAPVRKPLAPIFIAFLWWLVSWFLVIGVMLAYEPMRPGALNDFVSHPQFALESVVGLMGGFLLSVAAFRQSIPGLSNTRLMPLVIFLLVAWVLAYVAGFVSPALETGMLGKREHCPLEALLYPLPGILGAAWLFRARYSTDYTSAGLLVGLAAGAMPALFMQFACMYEPAHILKYHLSPVPIVALVSVALFYFVRKR